MKKNTYLILFQVGAFVAFCAFCGSCITERNYFLSPNDINSHSYHAMPMHADSNSAATYASAAINIGRANQAWRDAVSGFAANLHRSHNFGNFQAYYGAGFNVGSYGISESSSNYDTTSFEIRQHNVFYGSYGANLGLNFVLPFANGRAEWRVIGVEASGFNEFGQYLKFRKGFPDSALDINAKYSGSFTLGGSTEIVGRSRSGNEFGYKLSIGGSFVPSAKYVGFESNNKPYYVSNNFHLTVGKSTGFIQFNIGSYSGSFQMGFNYRLGK